MPKNRTLIKGELVFWKRKKEAMFIHYFKDTHFAEILKIDSGKVLSRALVRIAEIQPVFYL